MHTRSFVSFVARSVTGARSTRRGYARVSFGLAVALLGSLPVHAQLVRYSFGTASSPTTSATAADPLLTASAFSGNIGNPTTGSGSPTYTAGSGSSYFTASGWNALVPGANFFEFTLTPEAGYGLSATDFSFGYRASGTGPTNFSLRSSADAFVSSFAAGSLLNDALWHGSGNLALNVGGLEEATTFRLYAFGAASSAGTFRVDDVSLAGAMSPIPEPSTYAAIFGGIALLAACVARRRGKA